MAVKWALIAVVSIFLGGTFALVVTNIMQDPIAQQIQACNSSCGFSGMKRYDADKKHCECSR